MSLVVVHAERVAAGGDAIAHLPDGRVVFVRGAIPGESVAATVTADKRDFAKAEAVEVLEPSPHRVAAPCPELARGCGGCAWQHIAPGHQLQLKVEVVRDALRRTGRLPDADVRPGAAVDPWGYRTSLRLAVAGDGRLALRAAASHDLVQLGGCPVAHPSLAELVVAVRARRCNEVSLRVGVASGERSALADRAHAVLTGLPPDVGTGEGAVVHETVAGAVLRVSSGSFFQSGPQAAELLVDAVARAAGPELLAGPLVDAYGGVGLFAATLASGPITLVESSPSACNDAAVNLAGREVTILCSTVEAWSARPAPLVIADPSRSGLGSAAAASLAATGAERVVLVSCDPVAMARDARLLTDLGYELSSAEVLDLFPHTPHVEVVGTFRRVR